MNRIRISRVEERSNKRTKIFGTWDGERTGPDCKKKRRDPDCGKYVNFMFRGCCLVIIG